MSNQINNSKPNLVVGRITDNRNKPLANLIVEVYDRDMRSEELLVKGTTNKEGRYELIWFHSQLSGRGKKGADLLLKVRTPIEKILIYTSDVYDVRFNASEREEINIQIEDDIKAEGIEYNYLLKEVTFLANTVPIAELQENNHHQDVTFLSKELEVSSEKIEHLILAHRLQNYSKVDASFFYALLRRRTLFGRDIAKPFGLRLSIGVHTNWLFLLYDIALLDKNIITSEIEQAVNDKIVARGTLNELAHSFKSLAVIRSEAEKQLENDHQKNIVGLISDFIHNDKTKDLTELLKEEKDDIGRAIEVVEKFPFFKSDEKKNEAKSVLVLSDLLGFGNKSIPGIIKTNNIKQPEDIKKLAKLNKQGWVQELTRENKKTKGTKTNAEMIDAYASAIVRKMEVEYPTIAYVAQLEREQKAIFRNQDKIVDFFAKNEKFDLLNDNVDLFLKDQKIKEADKDAIRGELKSIQRVFKLVPNYSKANALIEQNVFSAQSIVSLGSTQFIKKVAKEAGIQEEEAKRIYQHAERKGVAAMLLQGKLLDLRNGRGTVSSTSQSEGLNHSPTSSKIEKFTSDFPNLKTLFQTGDSCECTHCRSVYSASAYLVEILQFLDKRFVSELKDVSDNDEVIPTDDINENAWKTISKRAKDVLFERRPDLGEIDLNCENANTPVKYIDLVCELLESFIAPDESIDFSGVLYNEAGKPTPKLVEALTKSGHPISNDADFAGITFDNNGTEIAFTNVYLRDEKVVFKGVKQNGVNQYRFIKLRQTLSSAEELAAAPEYVNRKSYQILKESKFSFELPFDLDHTEAKAYFDRLGISRFELMKQFQLGSSVSPEALATERLGLTIREREIITKPQATLAGQQSYWNTPLKWNNPIDGNTQQGSVVEYMKRVDHFLDKTGLTFKELRSLLKLSYINPDRDLRINDINTENQCDAAGKIIEKLTVKSLDRIHRFLRLQKKTGWSFHFINELTTQKKLGKGKRDGLEGYELLIKAGQLIEVSEKTNIPLTDLIGFYGEIPHGYIEEDGPKPLYYQVFLNKTKNGFIDEGFFPEYVENPSLNTNSDLPYPEILTSYSASLATILQLSMQELDQLFSLLPDDRLNFSNLSYLFAATTLSKRLNLKIEDYLNLVKLSGLNISESPQSTLDFIRLVENFKKSRLSTSHARYFLTHYEGDTSIADINEDAIKILLESIQEAYLDNLILNASQFDDNLNIEENINILKNELLRLDEFSEEDINTTIQYLNKNWTDAEIEIAEINEAKIFVAQKFAFLHDDIENAFHNFIHSSEENVMDTAKELIKTILLSSASIHSQRNKNSLLAQTLADNFKSDIDFIQTILKHAKIKQYGPEIESIADIFLDEFLNPIDAVGYPKQYAAIQLLHKLIPLIQSLGLTNEEVSWYLEHNASLGWFELDAIPYDKEKSHADFSSYLHFLSTIDFTKKLANIPNPFNPDEVINFYTLVATLKSSGDQDKFFDGIALLSGFDKTDLIALDDFLFTNFNVENYKDVENWQRILDCAVYQNKLGLELSQIKALIESSELSSKDVTILRSSLKARYSESSWLSTQEEIMDVIRVQKRDALIGYILATEPNLKDKNGLYDYFLVDVQMEACMPSSRIVQAHNSIQLFITRCLMGLEPKARAEVDSDPGWKQWAWMKNYRVWEANRKVFLYPENWYDVSLTDNKSSLLSELIDEMQQDDLTEDVAEQVLANYLEKLDDLAFLEVKATWYQTNERTMHVFARTKGGDPSMYYYRRFEEERFWTPWEKVDLDITGNHLLAFMRNNRLSLAWPIISQEADPNQTAKLPDQTKTEEELQKTGKKLKIQLAVSEYSNNRWQPKKISQDGLSTPKGGYTTKEDLLNIDHYIFIYREEEQQIHIYADISGQKNWDLCGVFNVTGCKGYPELLKQRTFSLGKFYPDFKNTELLNQRYTKIDYSNGLNVENGFSIPNYHEILRRTLAVYRITYPHQSTKIDSYINIFQALIAFGDLLQDTTLAQANTVMSIVTDQTKALGTLLPYFMEDSEKSYVVIPGFYKKTNYPASRSRPHYELNSSQKRTVSNILQLIDDILSFYNKVLKKLEILAAKLLEEQGENEEPRFLTAEEGQAFIKEILSDDEFTRIIHELSEIESFRWLTDAVLNVSIEDLNSRVPVKEEGNDTPRDPGLVYGKQFKNMYHPLVCYLRSIHNKHGISGLMKRETQLFQTDFDFEKHYLPNVELVAKDFDKRPHDDSTVNHYPIEDLDFSSGGSYSLYNWDLFFRIPLLMAKSLSQNQRFEEAQTWYHYMFNPTGALKGNGSQRYWVTKPFYLNQDEDYNDQYIDNLLYTLSDPNSEERKDLELAVDQWRNKPFSPDAIARYRPVAYQKALLMGYIDNLTEWGDYLFRQDTMESIAQATQLYILADKLLGPKPRVIPSTTKPRNKNYNELKADLDNFGNSSALLNLEDLISDTDIVKAEQSEDTPNSEVTLGMLYFCIPPNEKMKEVWDKVEDRLFKIRHCQNIDGVERSLALFAPPIDPAMIVKAASAGLDISSVIAGINAPTPHYRFQVIVQKANELVQEVRSLGSSLLQALEKKDAEALSLLRSEQEINVLNSVKDIKTLQISESIEQIEILKRTKKVTEERAEYYGNKEFMNPLESSALLINGISIVAYTVGSIMEMGAGAVAMAPDLTVGVSGFGGSPHATSTVIGGAKTSSSISAFARAILLGSQIMDKSAGAMNTLASYQRREEDWDHQASLAKKELDSIEKQITAAEIRKEIAETDLRNHQLQMENAQKTDEFMRSKFTNKELYDWMLGQISSVYFKSYQLAHDFAKKAERSYKFELGNDDTFISYGYWDSMKKGLQSADHLIHDIKRMETSYIDKNKREYEITKHVSLALLDPLALLKLRTTGVCDFDIPEAMYDMDHAGHYFRRLKSVSISIPCISGPYTSISAKLSLINNRYRKNTALSNEYSEDSGNDDRFVYNIGAIQSIATSNAQNDSGVFELNFRDERYLPFEGTGAISSWRLELPDTIKQFDYNTISDAIIHVKYTSREGGSGLRTAANQVLADQLNKIRQSLNKTGLQLAINVKHDLPNEWHLLKQKATTSLKIDKSRLPYMVQSLDTSIVNVFFAVKLKKSAPNTSFFIQINNIEKIKLDHNTELDRSKEGKKIFSKTIEGEVGLNIPFTFTVNEEETENLEELIMVINYKIS